MKSIDIGKLRAHPSNSNRMSGELLRKLVKQIEGSGQYPPVIVRRIDDGDAYQILDGHHRVKALEKLGYLNAQCVVWEADDKQALMLLATLNRLQGSDNPHDRAKLFEQLVEYYSPESLPGLVPEDARDLERLLSLNKPPVPASPRLVDDLPVSVHFFLARDQARCLNKKLAEYGGTREDALMGIVCRVDSGV